MARRKDRRRGRVGKVSFYPHHGAWWLYYRETGKPARRKVAETPDDAEKIAAQVNAQLVSAVPTLLAFEPIAVSEMRRRSSTTTSTF
jgi:integrase